LQSRYRYPKRVLSYIMCTIETGEGYSLLRFKMW